MIASAVALAVRLIRATRNWFSSSMSKISLKNGSARNRNDILVAQTQAIILDSMHRSADSDPGTDSVSAVFCNLSNRFGLVPFTFNSMGFPCFPPAKSNHTWFYFVIPVLDFISALFFIPRNPQSGLCQERTDAFICRPSGIEREEQKHVCLTSNQSSSVRQFYLRDRLK